ncbi:MAG TPA: hypothetical protein VHU88_17405 [Sporichthyaceae bacterium]|nr:hypothetical protein [Sporichthyaceae bacterium]
MIGLPFGQPEGVARMDGPGTRALPEGYRYTTTVGAGPSGDETVCRAPDGREVVVRVTGVEGDPSSDLFTELSAAAAAAEHPCSVGIRPWSDPALGVCVERIHVPGGSLAERSDEALAPEVVAAGGARLAAALAFAHSRGVLHGDVRPANVLLGADGDWLLSGVGVARAVARAKPGDPVSPDPAFAPRELRGWERPAPSADVFSLGAVLYAALAGAVPAPNSGASAAALPGVPAAMAGLIDRMMAPNPADRPSLVEVDQVLRPLVPAVARGALPAAAAPLALVSQPRPKLPVVAAAATAAVASGRNRVLVAAAAIGAVFLGGATAVAVGNSGGGGGKAVMTAASAPPVAVSAAPTSAAPKQAAALSKPVAKPAAKPQKPAAAVPPAVVAAPVVPKVADTSSNAAAFDPQQIEAFDVKAEPSHDNGYWQLKVVWEMSIVPPAVRGWHIFLYDPNTDRQTDKEYGPRSAVTPPRNGPTYEGVYYFNSVFSVASCVRVQTDAGPPTPRISGRACPDPKQVQAAQAAIARGSQQGVVPANTPAKATAPAKPAAPATPPKPAPKTVAPPPAKPAPSTAPKTHPN